MKSNFVFFCLLVVSLSCAKNEVRDGDPRFWNTDIASIVSDSISILDVQPAQIIVNEPEQFIDNDISLETIFSEIDFIKLKFLPGRFLGGIDKIQYDDNFIIILDKFQTKSLNVFDFTTGQQIFVVDSGDDSPFGPYSIFDFDFDSSMGRIQIYDENQSRILQYSMQGQLLSNKRINFAFFNFVGFNEKMAFYTVSRKNSHLGENFSESKVFISDSTFRIVAHGLPHPQEHWNNNFVSRDYFRKVDDKVYFMPRFEPDIYEIQPHSFLVTKFISFSFKTGYVSLEDISSGAEKMFRASANDGLYYSHGKFMVSSNGWIHVTFDTWKNKPLLVFYNVNSGEKYLGTRLINAPKGLPFFSSIIASYNNSAMGFLDPSSIRAMTDSIDYLKYVEDGTVSSKLASFIADQDDLEDQILVVYTFK